MQVPQGFASQLKNAGAQRVQFFKQSAHRMAKFRIRNNARNQAEALSFRRIDLPAGEDKIGGGAHSDEVWQSHHRNGRKTSQLDFGLAELRGFRSKYEIAKSCKLHAAAEAVSVDGGDFHAIGFREAAKNGVECP